MKYLEIFLAIKSKKWNGGVESKYRLCIQAESIQVSKILQHGLDNEVLFK